MIEEILVICLRTLLAISLMFFLTKLLGKRQLSEISLFGYISGISIGNIAAYIALENEGTWLFGITSLLLWVLTTLVLERLTLKSKKLRKYIDSDRRMLIKNGVILKEELAKENLTIDELLEQLRNKDVFRLADVKNAAIEANGQISVLLKAEHTPLTASMIGLTVEKEEEPMTIIVDGSAEQNILKENGLDINWLNKQLAQKNVKLEEVFVAQYIKDKEITLFTLDRRFLEINLQQQADQKSDNDKAQFTDEQLEVIKKSLLQAIAILEQNSQQAEKSS